MHLFITAIKHMHLSYSIYIKASPTYLVDFENLCLELVIDIAPRRLAEACHKLL